MKKAEMSKMVSIRTLLQFFDKLKHEEGCTIINNGTAIFELQEPDEPFEIIYFDETSQIKFEDFNVTFLNVSIKVETECFIAYSIISSKMDETVLNEVFQYLKSKECFQKLKLIVGPLTNDVVDCAKEVFQVEYTTSWFHIREIIKDLWIRKNLFKDENDSLSSALALPLLPATKIAEGCTCLIKIAIRSNSEEEKSFAQDVFSLLTATLENFVSFVNTKTERYDSALSTSRKMWEQILKSKNPGELFAKIKQLINVKRMKKPISSEISVKAKDTWHKLLYSTNKLEVFESIIILRNESKKFSNITRQRKALQYRSQNIDQGISLKISPCIDETGNCIKETPKKRNNKRRDETIILRDGSESDLSINLLLSSSNSEISHADDFIDLKSISPHDSQTDKSGNDDDGDDDDNKIETESMIIVPQETRKILTGQVLKGNLCISHTMKLKLA
ncbi:uncharacterized protein LOC127278238 [Leptopilina boulardi]|uniref:uncharacterized protein LOC127278238 n=1 Tax=Leptopilina boulardi TaxID=63433 RepID=UPI0021F5B723|nr:uncharacterized protein LOC127278238 [Leptopilina boulardi]